MKLKKFVSKNKNVVAVGTLLNAPIGEEVCLTCNKNESQCECQKFEKLINKLKNINKKAGN